MDQDSCDIGTPRRSSGMSFSSSVLESPCAASATVVSGSGNGNANGNSGVGGGGNENPNVPNQSSSVLPPNITGSSLLSSRVSQSRYFGTMTPVSGNNGNGLSNLLINPPDSSLAGYPFLTASPVDTAAATAATTTIHTVSSNGTSNLNNAANNELGNQISHEITSEINDELNNDLNCKIDTELDNAIIDAGKIRSGQNTQDNNVGFGDTKDTFNHGGVDIIDNADLPDITISTADSTKIHSHQNNHLPHNHYNTSQLQQQNLTGSTNNSMGSVWLSQQQSNSLLNVTPWIEQQAQVSPNLNFQYSLNGLSSHSTGNDQNLATNLSLLTSSSLLSSQLSQQQQLRQPQYMKTTYNNSSSPKGAESVVNTNNNNNNNNNSNSNNHSNSSHGYNYSNYQQFQNSSTTTKNLPMTHNGNDPKNSNNNNNNSNNNGNNNTNNRSSDDDELIPTAIVIKNIPFAIKKEQLLDVMSNLNLPLPYAFNYHFDNGVFRGLAFANFNSVEETALVVSVMNGRDIDGRKLRVEYKKMLPLQERERIEREKKERRYQLEEQHRSTSVTSLASLYSTVSAPPTSSSIANLNNLHNLSSLNNHTGINNFNNLGNLSNINNVGNIPNATNVSSLNAQTPTTAPSNTFDHTQSLSPNPEQQDSKKSTDISFIEFPSADDLPVPPANVDFNKAEILEFYTMLLVFKEEYKHHNSNRIVSYATSNFSSDLKASVKPLCEFLNLELVETNVRNGENNNNNNEQIVTIKILNETNELNADDNNDSKKSSTSANMPYNGYNAGSVGNASSTNNMNNSGVNNATMMNFPPSLIRSHSHTVLASNPGLSINTNRYRQQSRNVSQTQQNPYNNQPSLGLSMNNMSMNSTMNSNINSLNSMNLGMNLAMSSNGNMQSLQQLQQHSQQQTNQLHHSSSTASLNLLRNKGLTTPTTPNTSRQATFPVNHGLNTLFNTQSVHNGFNNAQITGGSNISVSTNKGIDDLYNGMEYLNFDHNV